MTTMQIARLAPKGLRVSVIVTIGHTFIELGVTKKPRFAVGISILPVLVPEI